MALRFAADASQARLLRHDEFFRRLEEARAVGAVATLPMFCVQLQAEPLFCTVPLLSGSSIRACSERPTLQSFDGHLAC